MAQNETVGQKQIKVFYEHDPGYRMIAANGIFGGITPRGELRIDFFSEYSEVPKSVTLRITKEGTVTEEQDTNPRIVRMIQMGVLVPADHIESFADWFQAKAEEIKQRRKHADEHTQPE